METFMNIYDMILEIIALNSGVFGTGEFGDEMLIRLISDLDERIYNDIIMTHEGAPAGGFVRYDSPEYTGDGELIVSGTYSPIYRHYCAAEVYLCHGENDLYNLSVSRFNSLFEEFANYYNRTHMPIRVCSITF